MHEYIAEGEALSLKMETGSNNPKCICLTGWYSFPENSKVYYTDGSSFNVKENIKYDYVVCHIPIDLHKDIDIDLDYYKGLLDDDGILLLAANNKLGIRYFCGDSNPVTDKVMDFAGLYSKSGLKELLRNAGFAKIRFYSVFSVIDNPTHIINEEYIPNEDLANRLIPAYNSPDTVFYEEEELYRDLINNGMLHQMANAFLIEASKSRDAVMSDVQYVTSTASREPGNAFFTVIHDDGIVTKENIYPEGVKRFEYMETYAADLRKRGISVVEMKRSDKGIQMPYITAPTGQFAMKEALIRDKYEFIHMMDKFRECIVASSDIERVDVKLGPIARYGYIDMVPLNSFYVDDHFVFFDQEFRLEHYPINVILFRMIATFYYGNRKMTDIITMEDMLKRYGLLKDRDIWYRMEWDFLSPLRNEKKEGATPLLKTRNDDIVRKNRKRMNFPAERYDKIFNDMFSGFESKDVYVFGSGRYADAFMKCYTPLVSVKAILDNDSNKWKKSFFGVEILSPDVLTTLSNESYKVVICIKDYMPVIKQLDELGVADYSVYDGRTVHPRHLWICEDKSHNELSSKKYKKGYVAGAFDMFHIGHLNLLRRAKEQCEYLVAGIMSDEKMYDLKGKNPVIPLSERMQVVAGCRYVDEVIELTIDRAGIWDVFEMVHFDCMFSGDDHADNPDWLAERERLRRGGSDIVFLPYTKETSSSDIRDKLAK